jgi:hypothetical protein
VLILYLYPGFDAAVMMYAGLPLAALSGIQLANWRAAWIVRRPVEKLNNFYEVEIKIRYFMQLALAQDLSLGQITLAVDVSERETAQQTDARDKASKASIKANLAEADGASDGEARMLMLRSRLTPELIKQAELLLSTGLSRFKTSTMLHIFAARFYSVFVDNHHMEMR